MQKISITHTDTPQLSTIPQHTKIRDKSSSQIEQEQKRRRPNFCLRGSAKEALPSPVSINTNPPRIRNPDKIRETISTSPPSKIVQQQASINKLFKQKKRELANQQQMRQVRIKIDTTIPPKLLANESEDEGKSNGTSKQLLAASPPRQKQNQKAWPTPFEKGKQHLNNKNTTLTWTRLKPQPTRPCQRESKTIIPPGTLINRMPVKTERILCLQHQTNK